MQYIDNDISVLADKILVDIILATYNGEQFITEQIESIINMSGFDDYINKIIICDDNSSDRTLEIIESIVPANKLSVIRNESGKNYGPIKNFERGILSATSEFMMLSDQDDVWDDEKIVRYVKAIQLLNRDKCLLVFSDLNVVDENLNLISPSFLEFQSIPQNWHCDIDNLLIQNVAPGCTMLFNQKLIEKALPFPSACIMHDWWLLLVAKLLGEIYFINDAFINYRQHGKNQVGAKKLSIISALTNFRKSCSLALTNLNKTILQMSEFEEQFEEIIEPRTKKKIEVWKKCLYRKQNWLVTIFLMLKFRLKKSSLTKTIGLYYLILLGKK